MNEWRTDMQNDRAIISCGVLAAIWIAVGIPYSYALYPLWLRCLTYHFFHANLFHLLANGFCLYQMIRTGRAGWGILAIAFIIASLIPLVYHGQIIGFSNILYAITGLSFFTFTKQTRWTFIIVSALMLPFPQIAGVPHFIALCLGIAMAFLINKLERIGNDIKSATYR